MKKLYNFLVLALLVPGISNAQIFCDQPQSTPGFPWAPACEQVICSLDVFCCETAWDSYCAAMVLDTPECQSCLASFEGSVVYGQLFVDTNCNGIYDVGEYEIPNQNVVSSIDGVIATSNSSGEFTAMISANGNHILSTPGSAGFQGSSSANIVTEETSNQYAGINIGLCPIVDYHDVEVSMQQWNTNWYADGTGSFTICVNNLAGWPASGILTLNFNDAVFEVINAANGIVNTNTIIWNITELPPMQSYCFLVQFADNLWAEPGVFYTFSLNYEMDPDFEPEVDLSNNIVNVDAEVIEIIYGGCDNSYPIPGYPDDTSCEIAICANDPFCCDTAWDAACASAAAINPACVGCLSASNTNNASGKVYLDADCNESYNALNGDVLLNNAIIYKNGAPSASSSIIGEYSVLLPNDTITTLNVNTFPGFTVPVHDITATTNETFENVDFGYCPTSVVENLAVTLSPYGPPPRPGFPMSYQVCVTNFSTAPTSAYLEFDYSGMPNATVINPDGGTQFTDYLTWTISDLASFETVCYTVVMQIAVGTLPGTPMNPIASVLLFPELLPDTFHDDNIDFFTHHVVAAYDPNDKTVDFPVVNHTEIPVGDGAELEYLIRFQNTGNFYATFVRVVDELPDLLDISTIHMINASHNYQLSFPEPNVLEWFFDEIMLPDSATDEPGSHGFIHFRIKTVPGVGLDDVIENNASIYFDFKAPIITEYAVTTFMDCSEGSLEFTIPEVVCEGDVLVLESNRNDFTEYQWNVGGVLISGEQIATEILQNSVIQLTAIHPVCTLSTSMDVSLMPLPIMNLILAPYVSCNGPLEIGVDCSGNLSWYYNSTVQGTGDPFVAPLTGQYDLYCENACGGIPGNIEVYIYETPEVSISIDENGALTVSPAGQTYIWYLDGQPIFDAFGQSYTPTQSGNYSVTVIFDSGCGSTSEIQFVPVSVGEELADKIYLFPNPANENVMLELPQGNWQVSFTDVTGKTILENQNLTEGRHNINLSALSGGLYLIRISSESGSVVEKLLVK